MGKNKFLEYINNSEFDRALENLSKKDFDDNEIKLNTALLKRYQGKLTESITILEELFKFKSELEDSFNLKVSLLLLYCYAEVKKAKVTMTDLNSYLSFLLEDNKIEDLGPFWLGIYEYSKGKRFESNREVYKAIECYISAVNYMEQQENDYETQQAYFLVGSTYRVYGDFIKAQEYLEKCLKIVSKSDEFKKAQYSNYSAEILFLRSKNNYKKALEYLQVALKKWESLKINFGISWAIHDLGLVYYLSGESNKAFEFLTKAFEFAESTDKNYKVRYLLSLIELATEIDNKKEAKKYYQLLEDLVAFDFNYDDEVALGRAFMLRSSQRLSDQMLALKMFEKLNNKNKLNYEFKFKILLNHLDLTLLELKYAKTDEALTVSKGLVQQLLDYTEQSYDLLIQTTVLIDKFNDIIIDKDQDVPFNIATIKELNTTLHSIPRLSIILYLLPRKGVTFSELEVATSLTQGNISNHTKRLIDDGIISSEKMFIDTKLVTVYNMTEYGIQEFETYSKT